MPNYLQRIAVSAVRTASPAKPAVSAPTIMPYVAAPGWLPAPLDKSEPAEALPDLESPPLRISPPHEVVSNRQSAAQPPDVASLDDSSPIVSAAEPQSRGQIKLGASTVHGPL